tara:strand:+ start:21278 stop:25564 length:4287 start_codon:yes stop_codon:yes gene_type:complete
MSFFQSIQNNKYVTFPTFSTETKKLPIKLTTFEDSNRMFEDAKIPGGSSSNLYEIQHDSKCLNSNPTNNQLIIGDCNSCNSLFTLKTLNNDYDLDDSDLVNKLDLHILLDGNSLTARTETEDAPENFTYLYSFENIKVYKINSDNTLYLIYPPPPDEPPIPKTEIYNKIFSDNIVIEGRLIHKKIDSAGIVKNYYVNLNNKQDHIYIEEKEKTDQILAIKYNYRADKDKDTKKDLDNSLPANFYQGTIGRIVIDDSDNIKYHPSYINDDPNKNTSSMIIDFTSTPKYTEFSIIPTNTFINSKIIYSYVNDDGSPEKSNIILQNGATLSNKMKIKKNGVAVSVTKRDIDKEVFENGHFKVVSSNKTPDCGSSTVEGMTVEGMTTDPSVLFISMCQKIVTLNITKFKIGNFKTCVDDNIAPFLDAVQNEYQNAPYHYANEIDICNFIEKLINSLDEIYTIINSAAFRIDSFVTTITQNLSTVIKSNSGMYNPFYATTINNKTFSSLTDKMIETIDKIKSHNDKVQKYNNKLQKMNIFKSADSNFYVDTGIDKIDLNNIFMIDYGIFNIFKNYFNIFSDKSGEDYLSLLKNIPNYRHYNVDIISELMPNKKGFIKKYDESNITNLNNTILLVEHYAEKIKNYLPKIKNNLTVTSINTKFFKKIDLSKSFTELFIEMSPIKGIPENISKLLYKTPIENTGFALHTIYYIDSLNTYLNNCKTYIQYNNTIKTKLDNFDINITPSIKNNEIANFLNQYVKLIKRSFITNPRRAKSAEAEQYYNDLKSCIIDGDDENVTNAARMIINLHNFYCNYGITIEPECKNIQPRLVNIESIDTLSDIYKDSYIDAILIKYIIHPHFVKKSKKLYKYIISSYNDLMTTGGVSFEPANPSLPADMFREPFTEGITGTTSRELLFPSKPPADTLNTLLNSFKDENPSVIEHGFLFDGKYPMSEYIKKIGEESYIKWTGAYTETDGAYCLDVNGTKHNPDLDISYTCGGRTYGKIMPITKYNNKIFDKCNAKVCNFEASLKLIIQSNKVYLYFNRDDAQDKMIELCEISNYLAGGMKTYIDNNIEDNDMDSVYSINTKINSGTEKSSMNMEYLTLPDDTDGNKQKVLIDETNSCILYFNSKKKLKVKYQNRLQVNITNSNFYYGNSSENKTYITSYKSTSDINKKIRKNVYINNNNDAYKIKNDGSILSKKDEDIDINNYCLNQSTDFCKTIPEIDDTSTGNYVGIFKKTDGIDHNIDKKYAKCIYMNTGTGCLPNDEAGTYNNYKYYFNNSNNSNYKSCITDSSNVNIINSSQYNAIEDIKNDFTSTVCSLNNVITEIKTEYEDSRMVFDKYFEEMIDAFNDLDENELKLLKKTNDSIEQLKEIVIEYKNVYQTAKENEKKKSIIYGQTRDNKIYYDYMDRKMAIAGISTIIILMFLFNSMKK